MHFLKTTLFALVLTAVGTPALAELRIFEDYDIGEEVFSMSTIKVDANMGDVYLAGLKETWVKSNDIAKELGHIKDYAIYTSELPASGEFNLVLLVSYENSAALEPNKKRYDAFMKRWGEKREKEAKAISAEYPEVREIVGEYRLREIKMK